MSLMESTPIEIYRERASWKSSTVSQFDVLSQHMEIGCPCLFDTGFHTCAECSAEVSASCAGRLHSAMFYFIELFEQSALANHPRKLEYILNRTSQIERKRDASEAFRYLYYQIQCLR